MNSVESQIVESFASTLARHSKDLVRGETDTLQVNVGMLCNQTCRHCHLEAGPRDKRVMSRQTMQQAIDVAGKFTFKVIDITGGAPEMVPNLDFLLNGLAPLTPRLMLRSNLTAIAAPERQALMELCADLEVVIVASFPSVNQSQTDAQRGKGVWEQSIKTLKRLNELGYGRPGTGLELDLVSNPTGAFLPVGQAQAEEKFKRDMARKFEIEFNHLYTFANVPLGRYRKWLHQSGNLKPYMDKLAENFNPCTINGLMCRTLVSVGWDGQIYDCDFNLARELGMGGKRQYISQLTDLPQPGTPIATSDHCYACTAGSGFT